MTPKFSTSCFIRKNTPELCKKLEDLGYMEVFCYKAYPILVVTATDLIPSNMSDSLVPIYTSTAIEIPNYIEKGFIDCGTNEQLFLAFAALRDDSDKFQWFCDDNGLWEMSESDLPSRYMQMNGHKATPDELIAYFHSHPQPEITD